MRLDFKQVGWASASLFFLFSLCACASSESLQEGVPDIPVLESTQNDAAVGFNYEIPAPAINPSWAQVGGTTAHAPGNLALSPMPEEIWSSDIGKGSNAEAKILASPIIVEGMVYVQDARGAVSAYTLESGSRSWRVDTAPQKADDDSMGGGIAWDKDVLYVATGFGEVLALRALDGVLLWRQYLGNPLRSAPTVSDGRVFVVTLENEMHVLEAKTGRSLWHHTGIAENASLLGASSPAVSGDTVVVPYSSGEIFGLRTQNGRLAWSEVLSVSRQQGALPAIADIRGLPVISDRRVYAISHSGRMAVIDQRTGNRIWDKELGGINTPSVVGQAVFVVTNEGHLVAMSRQHGEILWEIELQKVEDPLKESSKTLSWYGPIMAGGQLWLTNSKGTLAAYAPENGHALYNKKVAKAFYLPPIVAAQTMVLLSDNGELLAFR